MAQLKSKMNLPISLEEVGATLGEPVTKPEAGTLAEQLGMIEDDTPPFDFEVDVKGSEAVTIAGLQQVKGELEKILLKNEEIDPVQKQPHQVTPKPATKPASTLSAAVANDIESMIVDINEIPEYLTILGYGRTGTGKTTFGASADGTLLLEVEPEGTFSVATATKTKKYDAKKMAVKDFRTFEQLYFYLKANVSKYKVLTIDSLTRLLELCVKNIVLGEAKEGSELIDKDVYKVSLPQRGDIAQKMIFWLDAIRKLPIHKVWICQETNNTEDASMTHDIYPDLQRKIRNYVLADATIVGRFEVAMTEKIVGNDIVKTPQFRFITRPDDTVYTKDRTNSLCNGLINPTIEKILELVYKKGATK